jgi:DNA-3-methyladenine glycosylase
MSELRKVLRLSADRAAPRLLGAVLVSDVEGVQTSVRLSEVEAYGPDDPASHSFRGPTSRTEPMFGRPGLLYVYLSYGVHWCANVSTTAEGTGAAVLFRAGAPIAGAATMTERRGGRSDLADGPGKLCQALGIDGAMSGVDLLDRSSSVRLEWGDPPDRFESTPRIGITRAIDRRWRFVALDGAPRQGFSRG